MKQRIYPVMVLYKCKLSESRTYHSLLENAEGLSHFMVYDNSPKEYQQDLSQMPEGVFYLRDTSNSGLSIAYNTGAKKAKEMGYSHLLFLDQDTLFSKGTWDLYNDNLDFRGIVAPIMFTNQGMPFSPVDVSGWLSRAIEAIPGDYSLYKYNVANSGICVPLDIFEEAGGYDLNVYLDYSDNQFLRRVRVKHDAIRLMNIHAEQDFSGDCREYKKLLPRFLKYLDSANNFKTEGFMDVTGHWYTVFKHTVALSLRTKNLIFVRKFITLFLLKKSK